MWGGADPEFVGKLPIRTEIEVLPADPVEVVEPHGHITINSRDNIVINKDGKLKLGWTVKETIGIAVVNARGCRQGHKSIIVGE